MSYYDSLFSRRKIYTISIFITIMMFHIFISNHAGGLIGTDDLDFYDTSYTAKGLFEEYDRTGKPDLKDIESVSDRRLSKAFGVSEIRYRCSELVGLSITINDNNYSNICGINAHYMDEFRNEYLLTLPYSDEYLFHLKRLKDNKKIIFNDSEFAKTLYETLKKEYESGVLCWPKYEAGRVVYHRTHENDVLCIPWLESRILTKKVETIEGKEDFNNQEYDYNSGYLFYSNLKNQCNFIYNKNPRIFKIMASFAIAAIAALVFLFATGHQRKGR